jgi:hypothetical protein
MIKTVDMNYISVPEAVSDGLPVWTFGTTPKNESAQKMMLGICAELKKRIDK